MEVKKLFLAVESLPEAADIRFVADSLGMVHLMVKCKAGAGVPVIFRGDRYY